MRIALLVAAGSLAGLAACSSPSPVLYTIAPVPGTPQSGGPKVVVLQQISTARFLERSQIVASSENYRLDEDASGTLILQAQASVSFKGRGPPSLRSFRFAVPPPAPGVPGEVTAISTAVGQLADGLTSMLLAAR